MGMKQYGFIHGPISKVEAQNWGWVVTLDMDTYVRDQGGTGGHVEYAPISIVVPKMLVKGKNREKEDQLIAAFEEDCVPGETMYAEYELAVYKGAIQLKSVRKPEVGVREYRGLSKARREELGIPKREYGNSSGGSNDGFGQKAQAPAAYASDDSPPF